MAILFGEKHSKNDLLKYTGNLSQIAGIEEVACSTGRARGMRKFNVRTGNGLTYSLLPDKCLDISELAYRGVNIGFQTKNGLCSSPYAYPVLNEFDRYFSGGMLLTCGLKNTGNDYIDETGHYQHLHGRIGVTPCEQAWSKAGWDGDDYLLSAGGVTRDSILGGHNLTLTREVHSSVSKPEIVIHDTLENCEPEPTDYLILYHFNFGFPFIGPDTVFHFPSAQSPIKPRTSAAAQGLGEWSQLTEPVDGFEEHVFFHDPVPDQDGTCTVKIENPRLKIGAYLTYNQSNLPILTQWKSMRSGEYVIGIEPGNSYISGLDNERKNGCVGTIEAFGKIEFDIRLGFYGI